MFDRILTLSSSVVLEKTLYRERPSETAKTLLEVETCRILGYCGLTLMNERHLMPTIWTDLKKQPDCTSRETLFSVFFATLAEKEPSLTHFSNQTFFDYVVNH